MDENRKTYAIVIGVFLLMLAVAVLLLCGCNGGVTYIDGSKKVVSYPAGSVITTPDGEKHKLKNAEAGGSERWWLLTDKYLLEIHELIGREHP